MTPTRIPNKIQWGLRDIKEHVEALQQKLERGLEAGVPPEAVLGIFAVRLGLIERIASDALRGEYRKESRLRERQKVEVEERSQSASETVPDGSR